MAKPASRAVFGCRPAGALHAGSPDGATTAGAAVASQHAYYLKLGRGGCWGAIASRPGSFGWGYQGSPLTTLLGRPQALEAHRAGSSVTSSALVFESHGGRTWAVSGPSLNRK
jgi:hypothetical protein